jgi:hypothetical protein
MKVKLLILFFVFFISCKKNNEILSIEQVYEAQKKVLSKGDKESYTMLCLYYDDKKSSLQILPYSMIMAHQYNDKDAYYDVYQTSIMMFNNNKFEPNFIIEIDKSIQDFALKHLFKSSELGSNQAQEVLDEYLKNDSISKLLINIQK